MCGIFGFSLTKPVPMVKIFKVLRKLEVHQYPREPRPVGGFGAGVFILEDDGNVILEKVGAIGDSPAKRLSQIVNIRESSVLVGHVRMPSPEFMETARLKETAQPYVAKCNPYSTVVSAHNGKVENYREIREKLEGSHVFESEKVELIDSEIIPHLFEELLMQEGRVEGALDALFSGLEGSNTISLLQIEDEKAILHLVHKGRTRGLTVWTNGQNEVIFCSRKEPIMDELEGVLNQGKFKETISIPYRKDENFKASFILRTK